MTNNREELNDSSLENINGGSNLSLHFFDTPEQVRFIFFYGDTIYVKEGILYTTKYCRVVGSEVFYDPQYKCYEDAYIVRGIDDPSFYKRILRDDIVNQAE